jgi:hypothetical protein
VTDRNIYSNSKKEDLPNRALCSPHRVAGPSALIGASNIFELAVAAAIALFGCEAARPLTFIRREYDRRTNQTYMLMLSAINKCNQKEVRHD